MNNNSKRQADKAYEEYVKKQNYKKEQTARIKKENKRLRQTPEGERIYLEKLKTKYW